jgi:hypothetical protein
MKIYISGKITGTDIAETKAKFKAMQELIEGMGHVAVNPFEINKDAGLGLDWKVYMIADIKELFECDAIVLLTDWEKSRGARIEYSIAVEIGLRRFFERTVNTIEMIKQSK